MYRKDQMLFPLTSSFSAFEWRSQMTGKGNKMKEQEKC